MGVSKQSFVGYIIFSVSATKSTVVFSKQVDFFWRAQRRLCSYQSLYRGQQISWLSIFKCLTSPPRPERVVMGQESKGTCTRDMEVARWGACGRKEKSWEWRAAFRKHSVKAYMRLPIFALGSTDNLSCVGSGPPEVQGASHCQATARSWGYQRNDPHKGPPASLLTNVP